MKNFVKNDKVVFYDLCLKFIGVEVVDLFGC